MMILHRVEDADHKAFTGRLRVLRSLGVPDKPALGSGKRQSFNEADVFELHTALALDEFGLPPTRIAMLVKRLREDNVISTIRRFADETLWLMMSQQSNAGKARGPIEYRINLYQKGMLQFLVEVPQIRGPAHWVAFINATQLLKDITE